MWSNERASTISGFKFYVRCRTTNEMLGTQPGNPDLHRDFIESRIPDTDEDIILKKRDEESQAIRTALGADETAEEVMEKQMTIFPVARFFFAADGTVYDPNYDMPDGKEGEFRIVPFLYDYQVRGSFKESISMLTRASGGRDNAKENGAMYDCADISNYKKTVDGTWFVVNRKIPLIIPATYIDNMGNEVSTYDEHGHLRVLQRPLRADTARGPRTALASSEVVPAGTEFYFGIQLLNIMDLKACLETLDYKSYVGMLQWRGGGKGTLIWTLANRDGIPYDDLTVDDLTDQDKIILATIESALPGLFHVEGFDPTTIAVAPAKRIRKKKKAAAVPSKTMETPEPENAAEEAPKKRGRKKKDAESADGNSEKDAPKKRGRKKKDAE